MNVREHACDLMVIGSGYAGMAASLFALDAGLSVAQAGAVGGIDFSSGFLDLMGVHPLAGGRSWDDPWAAIRAVVGDIPEHPYALTPAEDIRLALSRFTGFLADSGLAFRGHEDRNVKMITSAGTIKRTYRVPESMWAGVRALERRAPCLLVSFHGLKGYSSRQMRETLAPRWPDLRDVRVDFPGQPRELYTEHMAWDLADPKTREALAATLSPHLGDAEYVGFPAMLGLYGARKVHAHMEELLGCRVFEVPTMPPSIPGQRLRAAFDRTLPQMGVTMLSQQLVTGAERLDNGGFRFTAGKDGQTTVIRSRGAVLATGRFFGKGLFAERGHVRETVFDLPVVQPDSRGQWHHTDFFHAGGHPVNRAGLTVDHRFRPLGSDGEPAFGNLHAAGAILAHQDWIRMKCGAGLAIATAYGAVKAFANGG